MSAFQDTHLQQESLTGLGGRHKFVVHLNGGVDTTGAADAVFAFVLVVKIEQYLALQPVPAEAGGAGEARLLVDGDQGLQGRVFERAVLKDGQDGGHADAVVGAEGGAVSSEPLAVQHRLDGVFQEVELLVAVLLTDHIHVGLQAHHGALLVALAGWFAHQHVAELVTLGLQTVLLAPLDKVG